MNRENTPPDVECPVCGATGYRELFRCTDHFLTGETFPLLSCSTCGFLMTGSPPPEETIGKYYQSEDYISHSQTPRGVVDRIYHLVRRVMAGRKAALVARSAGITEGALLDIGAGTGFFLDTMRRRGWQVTGTEPGESARQVALEQHGITLLPAEGLFSIPQQAFDVITLWHVLEHLHDPGRYWQEFRRLLRPGGTLVIALPNPASHDAAHYGAFWAAWDVPRHLWHFSPANLGKMAEQYGFRLTQSYRMPFDSFYVSILSEKYKKASLPLLRGLWFGFRSWADALARKQKCSSLIYVLKFE